MLSSSTLDNESDESIDIANASDSLALALHGLIRLHMKVGVYIAEIEITEVEMLTRKSLGIRSRLIDTNDGNALKAINVLSDILSFKKGDYDEERRLLLERALGIVINESGSYSIDAAKQTDKLTQLYSDIADSLLPSEAKMEKLRMAESNAKEALRISEILNHEKSILSIIVGRWNEEYCT